MAKYNMTWLDLQKHPSLRLVMGGAIAFFVFTLLLTLHRHYTFYSSYDQGIFNQIFWNSIHGHFFQSSLSSQISGNVAQKGEFSQVFYYHLGQHFNPIFLLWLPLYALFPSPATLIVLQVALVTAAGLVLYVLAQHYLEPPVAAMIAISFYGANAVLGPTLANFHDICPILLLVFGLLLSMEKRWWSLFWLLAALTLAVREDAGLGLFGVGFYLIVSRRYPRIGLAVCTLSFTYMLIVTNLIMELFDNDVSQRLMIQQFGQYTDSSEASPLNIIWGMVSHPWHLVRELFSPFFNKVEYLLGHWLPLAFVPAVSPAAWMIAGFPLLELLLEKGGSVRSLNIRYAMAVVPGLFYGAILWWAGRSYFSLIPGAGNRARGLKVSPLFQRFWIVCISLSVLICLASSPNRTLYFLLPDSYQPLVYIPLTQQWPHVGAIQALLTQIPPDASVSATTYIVPHVSSRRAVVRFPALQLRNDAQEVVNVDYAIADLWQLQKYQVAFKQDREGLKKMVMTINQITGSGEYGIIDFKDGVVLLRKGAGAQPEAMAAWRAFQQKIPS